MTKLGSFIIISVFALAAFTSCNKATEEDIPVLLTLQDDVFYTEKGISITLDILSNDNIKGDAITVSISDPVNGTIQAVEDQPTFIYTPNINFSDTETLTYEVCSGNTCKTAVASIHVESTTTCEPNLIALNDYVHYTGDTLEIPYSVLIENDIVECSQIDLSSFEILLNPIDGKLFIGEGKLMIIFPSNDWINDEFEYQVCTMMGGLCENAKVTVINDNAEVPTLQ